MHLRTWHLLTAKPILFIANVAEDGFVDNPYLEKVPFTKITLDMFFPITIVFKINDNL